MSHLHKNGFDKIRNSRNKWLEKSSTAIDEATRSFLGEDFHPEEAPRPTNDLLQHRIIQVRFARVNT